MGTMLTVNDINVFYGAIHAIKGVSLEVNEGEIVTLIGAWCWQVYNSPHHFRTVEA